MTDAARKPEAVASRERAAEDVAQSYAGDCEARSDDCDCPHCALAETTRDVLIRNHLRSAAAVRKEVVSACVDLVRFHVACGDYYHTEGRCPDALLDEIGALAAPGGPT